MSIGVGAQGIEQHARAVQVGAHAQVEIEFAFTRNRRCQMEHTIQRRGEQIGALRQQRPCVRLHAGVVVEEGEEGRGLFVVLTGGASAARAAEVGAALDGRTSFLAGRSAAPRFWRGLAGAGRRSGAPAAFIRARISPSLSSSQAPRRSPWGNTMAP